MKNKLENKRLLWINAMMFLLHYLGFVANFSLVNLAKLKYLVFVCPPARPALLNKVEFFSDALQQLRFRNLNSKYSILAQLFPSWEGLGRFDGSMGWLRFLPTPNPSQEGNEFTIRFKKHSLFNVSFFPQKETKCYLNQKLSSLYFALFFLLPFTSQAQTHEISGKIFNQSNEKNIGNVEIFNSLTSELSTSNGKGNFDIEVSEGDCVLQFFKEGFSKKTINFVVNKDTFLRVYLEPLSENIEEVTIKEKRDNNFGIDRLKQVEGTAIYAGKKTEVILLAELPSNKATNNARQIFAKIPGLNVWESDDGGLQLGIGGRGLDPNRTSNLNVRQNGYDISADALGYPESYYTPTSEAVEKIELVRGAASLQYGTQFGGMLNFRMKEGNPDKKINLNLRQSAGSFGLLNSFVSLGGQVNKLNYYTFFQHKQGKGFRPNSNFDNNAAYLHLAYDFSEKLKLTAQYTYYNYLAQQPGGLTDALFEQNHKQSIRERNYFEVDWHLLALILDYELSTKTKLNWRTFGLNAERNAVGVLDRIDRIDGGGPRDLLKGQYKNIGSELRLLHRYEVLKNPSALLIGTRFYRGNADQQQGTGSNGFDADFSFVNPNFVDKSDYNFPSKNYAFFVENVFNLSPQLSITPGFRWEYIETAFDGYFTNYVRDLAGNVLNEDTIIYENDSRKRDLLLLGIGLSYKPNNSLELYSNFSQNYRSITFNNFKVDNVNFVVDPNLQDERGFNADIGLRGKVKEKLYFDVSLFALHYDEKIGSFLDVQPDPILITRTFRRRANIADARILGLEFFGEWIGWKKEEKQVSLFVNTAVIDGKYINSQETAFNNKQVEMVPPINFKTGLTFSDKNFKANLQYTFVGEHFSDATNANLTPSAVEGIIPSYSVLDFSLNHQYKKMTFEGGINNILDTVYFTRRAVGYPGPGIIPAQSRSWYVTFGIDL